MDLEDDAYETTTAGGVVALRPQRYTKDGDDVLAWFDATPRSRRFEVARVTRETSDALEWDDPDGRHLYLRKITPERGAELARDLGVPFESLRAFKRRLLALLGTGLAT